ncbi:tubulin-specific chaperone cofactor E-like protein isoform X2 [Aethina tumida]|nr:tubulin-specific chaperone cofactor E-like protein isoform X2 [Aethina tumida]
MPSLLEALEQKYGESSTESDCSDDEGISVSIFVPCKSARTVVPALLILNDCDIATAGEKEALEAKCSGVEELDLAKNKLNHWIEVFDILRQMPNLRFVNLSFNVLSHPLPEVEVDRSFKWQHLKSLVLNSTRINWESVKEILDLLPELEELHLSLNDFNMVCLCDKNQKHDNEDMKKDCLKDKENIKHKHSVIKILHFTGNPIEDWREVVKLGYAFPSLESLVLAECPIKSLSIDPEDEHNCNREYQRSESECESSNQKESPHDSFRNLKVLNLNSTQLTTWDDMDRLAKFPNLKQVRVQGCPLWEGKEYTEHERRQLLISRLPNVEVLNGGKIDAQEREDAERAFIRYFMEKPESDRPERYAELVRIHGKLDPLVNVDLKPEKKVKVTFTCGQKSEVRLVDVYRTVTDLKSKLETFAGFPASKMRLFYVDQDFKDTIMESEEMIYPKKQLYSYNIRSGDEIIIESKRK